MKNRGLKYTVIICYCFLLVACAQINPLQGGSKDQFAPGIDSAGTIPYNGQTNFQDDEIQMKFTEYIALNNPKDNIIITPQLKNEPEISVKNKRLTIGFNERLLENTTYTISFNRAVTDITERNDSIFQFVFSTGDYIDSLEIEGKVSNAFTNKSGQNFLIALYTTETETDYDSIPFNDQPVYIAQTDQNGKFSMKYLKEGDYHLFAIKDDNKNLRLDQLEVRAFPETEVIHIGAENESVNLLAFIPENKESKLSTTKFTYPGRLEFIFSYPPEGFEIDILGDVEMELLKEESGEDDSLIYWLSQSPAPKMSFSVFYGEGRDTLKPLYKGVPDPGQEPNLTVTTNLVNGQLIPKTKLSFVCSEPVAKFDTLGVHFMTKDSVEQGSPGMKIENLRSLVCDSLSQDIELVKIDSGAITSHFGHSNNGDVWFKLEQLEETYFGTLILNVDTVFSEPAFIELLNEKNEVIRTRSLVEQMVFNELIPGKYQMRIIFDVNGDNEWTAGDLKTRRLPERVVYNKELIDIKSRWEKEVDWIFEN